MSTVTRSTIVNAHFGASIAASDAFFANEAPRVAECCRQMATRFAVGGTLFVAGTGAQASDAQHVSVEFVHPIIVGKRALPAIALTSDVGVLTASGGLGPNASFVRPLAMLARPRDILLALCTDSSSGLVTDALDTARQMGLLTVLISGTTADERSADVVFRIHHGSALVVQEVSETLYHVLWELVHVFLDAHEPIPSAFLTPQPAPEEVLLAEVTASTRQKARDASALRAEILNRCERQIVAAGSDIAARVARGGRVFTFGNGGSATDAQDAVADAMAPPVAGWREFPAMALTNDIGVMTAIANDVGFDHVFARQIAAFAGANDAAVAFSTSGASRNLIRAMTEARGRGLLTIAMSGGDGGALARSTDVDFCFTAPSEHLPRIQEAHATTWHALLAAAQEALS